MKLNFGWNARMSAAVGALNVVPATVFFTASSHRSILDSLGCGLALGLIEAGVVFVTLCILEFTLIGSFNLLLKRDRKRRERLAAEWKRSSRVASSHLGNN